MINLRKWYQDGDGTFKPGNKGIALNIAHLRRVSSAMNEAIEVAHSRGLVPSPQEGEQ